MIVDSSIWMEIFRQGSHADKCNRIISSHRSIKVPSLVIYELYKKIKAQISEETALEVVANLSSRTVLDLNREVALLAADLSLEYELPMADSVVLAHARLLNEELLTRDNDFRNIPGVMLI